MRLSHLVPDNLEQCRLLQGILLLEYCAGRDLHSALAVKQQGGRGERLFGWYGRGKQVALDVAKVRGVAAGEVRGRWTAQALASSCTVDVMC